MRAHAGGRCRHARVHTGVALSLRLLGCVRQIAVLKETEGKGSFCSLVMAVVVAKDVLLFCCFAINLEAATTVRSFPSFSVRQGRTA